jgi:D-arabinose 1-dehydrogenase-like Zn-dependent alcohol dehydrogenase
METRGCGSDSPGTRDDARRLGADEVVVSSNADEIQKHACRFDFVLDAVAADHDSNAFVMLLRGDGNIALVGAGRISQTRARALEVLPQAGAIPNRRFAPRRMT